MRRSKHKEDRRDSMSCIERLCKNSFTKKMIKKILDDENYKNTKSARFMFIITSLHEIYLITNRYLILKNRNKRINNFKLKYYIPCWISICLILVIPYFFIMDIRFDEKTQKYYWIWSDITKNKFFRNLIFLLGFTENILPILILVTMTILCQIEYKKRINIKSKITIQSIRNLKKIENIYTRITIIITVLFIIIRSSDFLSSLSVRFVQFIDIKIDEFALSLLDFSRQFTFLLLFYIHSMGFYIYKLIKIYKSW